MRLYFTHRSVYSSVIIREPFPFRKHKWIQDIQRDNGQKVGVLETLISKWCVFIHSLTLWLRETCRRGGRKTEKEGDQQHKGKRPSKHIGSYAHMNSQRQWPHAQGLHRYEPHGLATQRMEVNTNSHPYPKSISNL